MAFTEQGVAMLSSVLGSKTAISVNIHIIRVFARLREYAFTHKDILLKLAQLEQELSGNSRDIEHIFAVLHQLVEKENDPLPRKMIGFRRSDEPGEIQGGKQPGIWSGK